MNKTTALAGIAAIAVAGCDYEGGGAGGASHDRIRIVGSSTAYPYTTAAAEHFPDIENAGETSDIFTNPRLARTKDYITGRYG